MSTIPVQLPVSGVIVLDKPPGPTSHDMVLRLRRLLPGHRVGHVGTLDPFATGVLPLCVGRATRLAQYLGGGDKTYEAVVHFGLATDTGDMTGKPVGDPVAVKLDPQLLESCLNRFRGEIFQAPPSYSARKVRGVPLYRYARRGVSVEMEARKVHIRELVLLELDECRCRLKINCSPGTYIRVVAADLGAAMGCGAHLTALRRTAAGEFTLDHAVTSAYLGPESGVQRLLERLVSIDALLAGFPGIELSEIDFRRVANGSPICVSAAKIVPVKFGPVTAQTSDHVRLLSADGHLAAIGRFGSVTTRQSFAEESQISDPVWVQPVTVLL